MKKNIAIIILVISNAIFAFYSFSQKVAADEQRELAVQNSQMAQVAQAEAEAQRNAAITAQMEADAQRALAEENLQRALEKCK